MVGMFYCAKLLRPGQRQVPLTLSVGGLDGSLPQFFLVPIKIMFGIVIGLLEDEYGYVSLQELSDVEFDLTSQGYGKIQVRQQTDFTPTALKNICDDRLQKFLARFED